jgi:hypothetical protein
MNVKTILLSIAAIVFFAAAYRFGSHGFALHDYQCITFCGIAVGIGALLLCLAIRSARRKPE